MSTWVIIFTNPGLISCFRPCIGFPVERECKKKRFHFGFPAEMLNLSRAVFCTKHITNWEKTGSQLRFPFRNAAASVILFCPNAQLFGADLGAHNSNTNNNSQCAHIELCITFKSMMCWCNRPASLKQGPRAAQWGSNWVLICCVKL